MTAHPTTPTRALSGLAPRRSLGADPDLALLRRDRRPAAAPDATEPEKPPPGSPVDAPSTTPRLDAVGETPPLAPVAGVELADPGSRAKLPSGRDLPRYLRLTRKEARIREDQADRLAELVRRLNQARQHRSGPVGERITDNTLIRVAVDLLLERVDDLVGATEDELRKSVTH